VRGQRRAGRRGADRRGVLVASFFPVLLDVAGQIAKAIVERFVVILESSLRIRADAFGPWAFPIAWDARFAAIATFKVGGGHLARNK